MNHECLSCEKSENVINAEFQYSNLGVNTYAWICNNCGHTNHFHDSPHFKKNDLTSLLEYDQQSNKALNALILEKDAVNENIECTLESQDSTRIYAILAIALAVLTLAVFAYLDYRDNKEVAFYKDPKTNCEYFNDTKTPVYGTSCFPVYVVE